ncbi:MAG TPA: GDSL-type esterase/lipase family protein [Kutzneria sp.]
MTKIVLFGDSMLGRFTKPRIVQLESEVGDATVFNCAAGGWTSADGAVRAATIAKTEPDFVVLSFGANDCAPGRIVPLDDYASNLRVIAGAFAPATLISFLPPSVVEVDGVGRAGRTNAVLDTYRRVFRDVVPLAVDTDAVLRPHAQEPVHEDGLHLTDAAYRVVISALAAVLSPGGPARSCDGTGGRPRTGA